VALPVLPVIITTLQLQIFLGFPLGYFVAFHGFFALGLAIVTWFVRRQDAIDHLHRANEDH
jgi:putative solute:sodium symporter small subunit